MDWGRSVVPRSAVIVMDVHVMVKRSNRSVEVMSILFFYRDVHVVRSDYWNVKIDRRTGNIEDDNHTAIDTIDTNASREHFIVHRE